MITDRVREAIVALADQYPDYFYADYEYIGLFNNVIIKPNRFEAAGAVHIHPGSDIPTEEAILNARQLQQQTGNPSSSRWIRKALPLRAAADHHPLPTGHRTGGYRRRGR